MSSTKKTINVAAMVRRREKRGEVLVGPSSNTNRQRRKSKTDGMEDKPSLELPMRRNGVLLRFGDSRTSVLTSKLRSAGPCAPIVRHANAKTKPNFSKVKTSVATAPNRKAAGKSGGSESRKIQASDIQLVQNLIERCLQLYMSQKEVVNTLQSKAKIEPGFTKLVWQKLEDQNPDFFKAYYTRLKLKDQIILFNHLLEQQVGMYQKLQGNQHYMHQGVQQMHGSSSLVGTSNHAQQHLQGHQHHMNSGMQASRNIGNYGMRQGMVNAMGLDNAFGNTVAANEHLAGIHDSGLGGFGSPGASTNSMPGDLSPLSNMQVSFDNNQLGTPGGMGGLPPLADITDELGDGMNANFTLSDLSLELSNQITDGDATLSLFHGMPSSGGDNPGDDDAFKLPKNFSLGDMNTLPDL